MFTGIIQDIGTIAALDRQGDWILTIESRKVPLEKMAIGASVACNGMCLTVIEKSAAQFKAQVSQESLNKTTARHWQVGTKINLETALRMGDELGGHMVTGHIDGIAKVIARKALGDSITFQFEVPKEFAPFIAPKGSVVLDGVSLTVNDVEGACFGVTIIPHTQQETTFDGLKSGDEVNFEVDLIARYIKRMKRFIVNIRLVHDDRRAISSPEEIIAEAQRGRMFILADDEDRENEGDLIIPAQFATPEAINFMAKYGRGLICLAMERPQIERLGLPLMAQQNSDPLKTAFTVSIEAREGVTTGISAADRAHTIQTAISPTAGPQHIVTPGHVFPLMAREGGVLARTGHTEAAVDIARMAGLIPAGVICEIMNEDGTMARMPDLIRFAQFHNLKVGTVADLIGYRRRTETIVERRLTTTFNSTHGGDFTLHIYVNKAAYAEHVALVKGDLKGKGPLLVRMHALNVLEDVLGDRSHGHGGELQASMRMIAEAGRGVVVLLREAQAASLSQRLEAQEREVSPPSRLCEFSTAFGAGSGAQGSRGPEGLRDYGVGAQILLDLGVRDMILLSNSHRTIVGLEGYGLRVVEQKPILL